MFDQRGCGKSKPYGETKENTTSDLISDINLILENFSIDKINIYGGSWGSTLALLYAENNPERVATLTLRGVFYAEVMISNGFINMELQRYILITGKNIYL